MYPEWVEKYNTKGNIIRTSKNCYYLYKATSKRVEGKSYPVCVQTYIGKITEEGLIEPDRIYFTLGVDEIVPILSLCTNVSEKDLKILKNIYVCKMKDQYCLGKQTKKEIETIKKYLELENNRIWKE